MTISLSYNPSNIYAQKAIDYILSLGLFQKVNATDVDSLHSSSSVTSTAAERAQSFEILCSQVHDCTMTDEEILAECKASRQIVYNRHVQSV